MNAIDLRLTARALAGIEHHMLPVDPAAFRRIAEAVRSYFEERTNLELDLLRSQLHPALAEVLDNV